MTSVIYQNPHALKLHEDQGTTENKGTSVAPLHFELEGGNPVEFLRSFVPTRTQQGHCVRSSPSDEAMAHYTADAVNAIRNGDIAKLDELLRSGASFDACNRNGETLLMLACRRGDISTVRWLIDEARVQVDAIDGLGRTVLHDICWRPVPCFAIMDEILKAISPAFLLVEDQRGHTPLDYVRKHDWTAWNMYLHERSHSIYRSISSV
jgi:hypothetical protein